MQGDCATVVPVVSCQRPACRCCAFRSHCSPQLMDQHAWPGLAPEQRFCCWFLYGAPGSSLGFVPT